jgi:AcrR family transcriptional regulator
VAAADTRRQILVTARRLFAEQGFVRTSVKEIAEEAGVAVQTIYSSVGSKSELVLALVDLIDEESGIAELAADLFRQTKPDETVAKGVRVTRQLNERCGDLILAIDSAQARDPDAAAALADGLRRHDEGARAIVGRLADLGALRPDLTPQQAAAVWSMMTAHNSWRQLIQGAGWTYDQAENWLIASLTKLLLKQPPVRKAR